MTEQETVDRVTYVLTGEFYVGQKVRLHVEGDIRHGKIGVITNFIEVNGRQCARIVDSSGRELSRAMHPTWFKPI